MKNKLKRIAASVLTLALLCACGGKDAAEQTPAPETPPTQTAAAGGVACREPLFERCGRDRLYIQHAGRYLRFRQADESA